MNFISFVFGLIYMTFFFLVILVCEKEFRLNSSYNILWKKLLRMLKRGELSSRMLLPPRSPINLDLYCDWYSWNHCVHRFPFIACEIFTCEVDIILKTLVEDEEVRKTICTPILLSLKPYFCYWFLSSVGSWWICYSPFWNQNTPIAHYWLGISARYFFVELWGFPHW